MVVSREIGALTRHLSPSLKNKMQVLAYSADIRVNQFRLLQSQRLRHRPLARYCSVPLNEQACAAIVRPALNTGSDNLLRMSYSASLISKGRLAVKQAR